MLKFYHIGQNNDQNRLISLSQRCRFCESFYLSVLMYYTIVLTNHVLILREIFGIMSNKAGGIYD